MAIALFELIGWVFPMLIVIKLIYSALVGWGL